MKKLILLLFLFLTGKVFASSSNVIMLCNSTGNVCTPYSNLADAYNDANNGDIIYLPAGTFIMPNPLTKSIGIIGVGANLDSCSAVGGTTNISNNFRFHADNITLEGLNFLNSISAGTTDGAVVNNLKLRYCKLMDLGDYFNCKINNSQVYACYFEGYLSFGHHYTENYGALGRNNFISNCILSHLNRGEDCTIKNCIFNNTLWSQGINVVYGTSIENCIFKTPYVIDNSSVAGYQYPNNNVIQNCYYKTLVNGSLAANQIINSTSFNSSVNNPFLNISYALDPIPFPVGNSTDLASGIPSNLGINGGLFPWSQHGFVPSNPHVFYKNIADQTNNNILDATIKVRSGN